jgi:hypothetical protein
VTIAETLTARFTMTAWEPAQLDGIDGDWVGAAVIRKDYTSGLIGSGVVHFVSSGDEEHGRGYLAVERVVGTLDDGRSGAFTVHHGGLTAGDVTSGFAYVIPGSGEGDFAAFRGSGRIAHDEDGPSLVLEPEQAD